MPIIYKIQNKVNDRVYIGSTIQPTIRFRCHLNDLNSYRHDNKYLQHAWNKYGADKFKFEIIENCKYEDLLKREQYWLDHYELKGQVYNMITSIDQGLPIGPRKTSHKKKYLIHSQRDPREVAVAIGREIHDLVKRIAYKRQTTMGEIVEEAIWKMYGKKRKTKEEK